MFNKAIALFLLLCAACAPEDTEPVPGDDLNVEASSEALTTSTCNFVALQDELFNKILPQHFDGCDPIKTPSPGISFRECWTYNGYTYDFVTYDWKYDRFKLWYEKDPLASLLIDITRNDGPDPNQQRYYGPRPSGSCTCAASPFCRLPFFRFPR